MTRLLIPGKFTEEELAQELEELLKAPADPPAPKPDAKLVGIIDAVPADNGSKKTQEEWITYFNSVSKIMVAMPDLYRAGKSGSLDLLASLRKDFQDTWEISSTRVRYMLNNLSGRVIHYFNSNQTSVIESPIIIIPVYRGNNLAEVLNDKNGLLYLQTLLGTQDNAQIIAQTLHNLSNYDLDKIKVWTASTDTRSSHPDRAAGFDFNISGFHVLGLNLISDRGRSRGVRR